MIANEFTSLLMVPMHAGPATVGTLGLFDWYAGGVLNEADIDWMQRAADRVGLAIDNAQVRNQAIERLARLTSLSEIALAVASAQDVRQTLKLIVERVIATLRVDAADILLVDESDGSLSVAAAAGFKSRVVPEFRFGLPSEAAKQSMLEVKLALASPVDWMSQPMRSVLALEGLKANIASPLRVADKILGVLEVFSRDDTSAERGPRPPEAGGAVRHRLLHEDRQGRRPDLGGGDCRTRACVPDHRVEFAVHDQLRRLALRPLRTVRAATELGNRRRPRAGDRAGDHRTSRRSDRRG